MGRMGDMGKIGDNAFPVYPSHPIYPFSPFIGAYLMLRQRIRFALVPSADEIRNKFPGMLTGEGGFPRQIS